MRHVAKLGLKLWIYTFFLYRITYPGGLEKFIRLIALLA